jgi:adenine-specific DNA glycosylase
VFENGVETVQYSPKIVGKYDSLRQCNTCFVRDNCPAFKEDNECAFNLPVEVKTKDQMKSLLTAIVEMQAQRVAFMRFQEELNGGYADPNVSLEIERLFKIIGNMKDLETNKEFVQITASRETSNGVLSQIFGDKAHALKELNKPIDEDETTRIIQQNLEGY